MRRSPTYTVVVLELFLTLLTIPVFTLAANDCFDLPGISDSACQNQPASTPPQNSQTTQSAQQPPSATQGATYTQYRLLAPLPFIGNTLSLQNGDRQSSFANYVNSLYRLMVLVGSVLAVVMFAIGGFLYMTGEALDTKESGRSRMRGAVLGLLLLLAPYIILNAINPDLLKLSLNIPGVSYIAAPIQSSTEPAPGTVIGPPVGFGASVETEGANGEVVFKDEIVFEKVQRGQGGVQCPAYADPTYQKVGTGIASDCGANTDTQMCCKYKLIQN